MYVRTRGKRVATARDVLVTPEDVRARWDEILVTVREMDSLATHVAVTTALTQDQLAQHASTAVALGGGIDPQDIPATTTDHCSAYGGCFFRSKCFGEVYNADRPFIGLFHKEPKEIVMADSNVIPGTFPAAAAGGGPRMSLADRVKARNASGAAPAAQTAPPVASVPIGALQVATTPVTVTTTAPVAVTSSVCGAINPFLPGCDCTLMKHTGDHESTGPTGGKVSWSPDNSNMKLGASTDWKPIEPTVAAPTTASIVAAAATAAAVSPTVAQVLPPDAAPRTSTPEEVAAESAPKRGRKPKAAAEVAPAADDGFSRGCGSGSGSDADERHRGRGGGVQARRVVHRLPGLRRAPAAFRHWRRYPHWSRRRRCQGRWHAGLETGRVRQRQGSDGCSSQRATFDRSSDPRRLFVYARV